MSGAPQNRLGLLLAVWLMAAGCGLGTPSPITTPPAAARPQAPRLIELPADIRPLSTSAAAPCDADAENSSIAVQYQQPQAPAGAPIREPSSPPPLGANDGLGATPKRSEFVPIVMPQPSATPAAPSVPSLPAAPTFVAAAVSNGGPVLRAPVGSMAASPETGQPFNQPPAQVGSMQMAGGSAAPEPRNYRFVAMSTPDPRSFQTQPSSPLHNGAMQAVAQRAIRMADHGSATAQRGMFYSARTELLQALQLIAQALDVQEGQAHHAAALAAGLTALDEARDFSAGSNRPGDATNINAIIANHRTPLLRGIANAPISPVVAQQQYLGYAQSQFALAAGGVPAASPGALRLGRLQTAMATHDDDSVALHAPQSIVFHQAALATDGGNWLAANELGVLYARYGQLAELRQLLLHSVTVYPNVEGWHNLAVVHRRLGETDLAQRAEAERQFLVQKSVNSAESTSDSVRWVDPKTFAASGGRDAQGPADHRYAVAPVAASSAPTRR